MLIDAAAPAAGLSSAVLDFSAAGARVLENPSLLNLGGVQMELAAGNGLLSPSFRPALDPGLGLGVRYADAHPDRSVQVSFLNSTSTAQTPLTVAGLAFHDAEGRSLDRDNDGLVNIVTDRGGQTDLFSAFMTRAAGADPFFAATRFVLFRMIGRPFHVATISVAGLAAPSSLHEPRPARGFAARRAEREKSAGAQGLTGLIA